MKIIENKYEDHVFPTYVKCEHCGSILEYENVDLELHQCYMTGYKYRLRCPVCGVFIDAKWIKSL